MDRSQYVLNRLPHFWNKDTQDSKIRAIVGAIASELALYDDQIDYLDAMIGIDGTNGTDLDRRWGELLGIVRSVGESDDLYRNRIKTSITDLSGGTSYALQYSIGVVLDINNNPDEMDRRIKVYDAWEYPGTEDVDRSYGCSVISIDLDSAFIDYVEDIIDVVKWSADHTKASGVKVQLLLFNYRIMTYAQMSTRTYYELGQLRYDQLGATNI